MLPEPTRDNASHRPTVNPVTPLSAPALPEQELVGQTVFFSSSGLL